MKRSLRDRVQKKSLELLGHQQSSLSWRGTGKGKEVMSIGISLNICEPLSIISFSQPHGLCESCLLTWCLPGTQEGHLYFLCPLFKRRFNVFIQPLSLL